MIIYNSLDEYTDNVEEIKIVYNPFCRYLWVYNRWKLYELQGIKVNELRKDPHQYPIELSYKIDKKGTKEKKIIDTQLNLMFNRYLLKKIERHEMMWINYIKYDKLYFIEINIQNEEIIEIYIYEKIDYNKCILISGCIPNKIREFINKYLLGYNGFIEIYYNDHEIIDKILLKRGFSIFYPYKKIILCEIYKAELMCCKIIVKINDNYCYALFEN